MSSEEAEKIARNHARLARFKDRSADLLSEDLTLVSEVQRLLPDPAERLAVDIDHGQAELFREDVS